MWGIDGRGPPKKERKKGYLAFAVDIFVVLQRLLVLVFALEKTRKS
jgi:hypothetical protein